MSTKLSPKVFARLKVCKIGISEPSLKILEGRNNVSYNDSLHLSVSMRSFRAENVSLLIKQILDLNIDEAKSTLSNVNSKYPIVITRDLSKAKQWLKEKEQRINKLKEANLLKEKEIGQQRLEHEKEVRLKREKLLAERLAAKAEKEATANVKLEEPESDSEEN